MKACAGRLHQADGLPHIPAQMVTSQFTSGRQLHIAFNAHRCRRLHHALGNGQRGQLDRLRLQVSGGIGQCASNNPAG